MHVLWLGLALTAVIFTGLMAGALLAEACILVPFWRGLEAHEFLAHYRRQARALLRFFGPLEVAACLFVVLAGAAALFGALGELSLWLGSAAALLAILISFPIYFRNANARFAAGTIEARQVAAELARWARWHWLRTALAVTAFALAILASGLQAH